MQLPARCPNRPQWRQSFGWEAIRSGEKCPGSVRFQAPTHPESEPSGATFPRQRRTTKRLVTSAIRLVFGRPRDKLRTTTIVLYQKTGTCGCDYLYYWKGKPGSVLCCKAMRMSGKQALPLAPLDA